VRQLAPSAQQVSPSAWYMMQAECYAVFRIVDNLPAATKFLDMEQNTVYSLGFPLGFIGSTEVLAYLPV
jgi:hypothetical protein